MLKKWNRYIFISIIISIIFIFFGGMCIIKPDISFNIISWILTAIFLINGLVLLFIDYQTKSIFMNNFLYGFLSLIIGFILLIHPNTLKVILPFIIGIWFMINGILNIKFSSYIKEESIGYMTFIIVMAIISLVSGGILIVKPLESIDILTMTLGITCVISSISNIVDLCIIKKYISQIIKKIKKYIIQFEV